MTKETEVVDRLLAESRMAMAIDELTANVTILSKLLKKDDLPELDKNVLVSEREYCIEQIIRRMRPSDSSAHS